MFRQLNDLRLVSDDIILGLVQERVLDQDCKKGFLLDGFPRTIAQAEGLAAAKIDLDLIIEIRVDDEEIVQRMSGRWVHPPSGRTYHSVYNPPRKVGLDDLTGEPLTQRDDDQEATVRKRLSVYQKQTKPLVNWYTKYADANVGASFTQINGVGDVNDIKLKIFSLLS